MKTAFQFPAVIPRNGRNQQLAAHVIALAGGVRVN